MKKVFAILFFAAIVVSMVGSFANGSFDFADDSLPAILGNLSGTISAWVLFGLSGMFFLLWDKYSKLPMLQRTQSIGKISRLPAVLSSIYYIIFMLVCATAFPRYLATSSSIQEAVIKAMLSGTIWFVPGSVLLFCNDLYLKPYRSFKAAFDYQDAMLQKYLSDPTQFQAITDDGSILASANALYFKKSFSLIPMDQLASIETKEHISGGQVRRVTIVLKSQNGKKLPIKTTKAIADSLLKALAPYEA